MLVIVPPPGWKRRLGLLLGLWLLVGGVLAGLPWAIQHLGQRRDVWTPDQVTQAIEHGAVRQIVVEGNEVTVETWSGERFHVRRKAGESVVDLLRRLEVAADRLHPMEVLVIPPTPVALSWLRRWGLALPLLVLLLYIADRLRSVRERRGCVR